MPKSIPSPTIIYKTLTHNHKKRRLADAANPFVLYVQSTDIALCDVDLA